ncbi:hypothetical protein ElyMa_005573200 [Elysia marginata]|uniref:Uncharacterized protein n=1 Tax=Elysia marginata TaxID=1093978 RepID=A0AAV4F1D5_9GAST|nr:hypothetical protein ElyMa_005573200 [Elysia marginata]
MKLDRAYIKMLRVVKGKTWQDKISQIKPYTVNCQASQPQLRKCISEAAAGETRKKLNVVHEPEPKHGKRSVGGHQRKYIDQLDKDIGMPREYLACD